MSVQKNENAKDEGSLDVKDSSESHKATDFPLISLKKLENAMESLSVVEYSDEQRDVLSQLKERMASHLLLEEEYRRAWNELKFRYLEMFSPLYEQRRAILTKGSQENGTSALPGFWLKAMRNHLLLSEMIEDRDVPILECLQDIVFEWVDPSEQTSFKLDFHFSPNEHFENTVLTKRYNLERADDDDEEAVLTSSKGTEIMWKPGKDITKKEVTRKQRNKRTNQVRTVTQLVDENSFFNYFQSHEIPTDEDLETMEERDVSELEMIVEAEFEVGCILRDKIVPRAFGWYLGIERDTDVDSEAVSDNENDEHFRGDDTEDSDEDAD